MPDSFLRSDFMGASLLGVFEELFCGIGEDSLFAAEVRARPLIGSGVRGAARLLKCVLVVQCSGSRAASDVVSCVGRLHRMSQIPLSQRAVGGVGRKTKGREQRAV